MFRRDALSSLTRQAADLSGASPATLMGALRPLAGRGLVLGMQAEGRALTGGVGQLDPAAPYEIASVTKPFTAALLGQLAAAGQLDPLAPVAGLGGSFAGMPPFVTPYALATHTAGLPAHPLRAGLTALLDPYAPYSLSREAAIASARRWAAAGQAGRFGYSNLGAGVLALALAEAGGLPYPDLLAREVTGPLGLRITNFLAARPPARPQRATDFGTLAGAGGLWATADDLLRFGAAHLSGPLAPGWTLSITPRGRPPGTDEVAPGWFVTGGVWWHDGVARQSRAGLAFCPASGRVAALLVAGPPGSFSRGAVRQALLTLLPPRP
ncbi:serine hydrolase [Deinococcus piscis]|uniref:Serine hydrolase n=1 Tax=Deinococcus piscis TaxID=394230 RepID=A0ABQ3K030_9DEIO|nr:serine hydrolase domain-containing protein [Deinococcus piscis]GHF93972.1 serine hydrolase [Deinococcus piscis]